MATRTITLLDQDISNLISDTPAVIYDAGEYGQVLFADTPSITGNNSNGIWDNQNPGSFLFGAINYDGFIVDVKVDGVSTIRGSIKSVRADNTSKITEIDVLTPLQKMLQQGCIYTSDDEPETPAVAAFNILDLYKIPCDSNSFSMSNTEYIQDDVYIMVNSLFPDMTVLDVLQNLCEIGLARMYAINGIVFFDAFKINPEPVSIYTFSDRITNSDGITLFTEPKVELVEKEPILGYTINTATGPVQDGPESSDKGKSINGKADDPITIKDKAAGTSIGLRWVNYSQYRQTKITVGVPSRIASVLELGHTVTIDYSGGKWDFVDMTITGIDKSNPLITTLTGVTP